MIHVDMTDEQAKTVRRILDKIEDDAHWAGRGPSDEREHAKAVHDKIDKAIKAKEWK